MIGLSRDRDSLSLQAQVQIVLISGADVPRITYCRGDPLEYPEGTPLMSLSRDRDSNIRSEVRGPGLHIVVVIHKSTRRVRP